VLAKLNSDTLYELTGDPRPRDKGEVIRKMVDSRFIIDNLEGSFDISNLGAILLARDIGEFPSIAGKSVRIIKYLGRNKARSELEQEGRKGYAVGFSGMMKFLMARLPAEEKYMDGIRRIVPVYPETAIREVIANALIHQDFTIAGAGPVIEFTKTVWR